MEKYTLERKEGLLYRVRALIDFSDVKAGDLGGLVESEENLSHNGNCWVYGNAEVGGNAIIYGNTKICGNAKICGDVQIWHDIRIGERAYITSNNDYLVISNIGSRRGTTTVYRAVDGSLYVTCGCFSGTIDEFKKAVLKTHAKNPIHRTRYLAMISFVKTVFENS